MKDFGKLKKDYINACEAILQAFCEKYELPYCEDSWVGGEIGTIACIGDYFIDFQHILFMMSNDIKWQTYLEWTDYIIELGELGFDLNKMNFQSWCKGCPKYDLTRIQGIKKDLIAETEKIKDFLY